MKSKDEPNPLDQMLSRCFASRDASDEHMTKLTSRIQLELRSQATSPHTVTPVRLRAWAGILAVAASLLIGAFIWRTSMVEPNQVAIMRHETVRQSMSLNADAAPQATEASFGANQSLVFEEMQRVFDQRLAWVAETGQDILMEVDSEDSEDSDSRGPLMCIRLTLASRPNSESGTIDRKIWEMDVIVRSEQTVRIDSKHSTPQLVLWPFVTDDGKVLVETQLHLAAPNEFDRTSTCLLSPGSSESQEVFEASFVLSQRVVLLKEPAI